MFTLQRAPRARDLDQEDLGEEIEQERVRQEENNREVDLAVELDGIRDLQNTESLENLALAKQIDLFGSSERQTLSADQEPRRGKQDGNNFI